MPLDSNARSALKSALQAAFTAGVAQATSDAIALQIAAAYDTYAKNGQSCAPAPPSVVKLSDLQDKLKEALQGTNPDGPTAAGKWQVAFDAYWEGALFGPTGSVTAVTGSAALKSGLGGIFSNTANTLPSAAEQIAQQLETYTKTVTVKDAALPMPPGCGPAPIS